MPDKVHNQALSLITGAMRSTPIMEIERNTGVKPLSQRRDAKILIQKDPFTCMPNHPMKTRLEGLTENRVKRSSFVHEIESKKLIRQFQDREPQRTLPLYPEDMSELWIADITGIMVYTTVPFLSVGDTQGDTVPHPGYDCREISTGSMDPCIHRWVSNQCGD